MAAHQRCILGAGGAAGAESGAADRASLRLELQGLSLDNLDALDPLKLNIQAS